MFDYIGLDTYRDAYNINVYGNQIKQRIGHGKPVLIVEFGSCSYNGAAERGANGFEILRYEGTQATVPPGIERNEQVQASYIAECLDTFEAVGADGAFIFTFSEPMLTHSSEITNDLDIASFGIVKIIQPATETAAEVWEKKAAFDIIADRFKDERSTKNNHKKGR